MTIPTEIILPKPPTSFQEDQTSFLNDLIFELERRLETVAISTNGTYLYENDDSGTNLNQRIWKPRVFSGANEASYSQQVGYTIRKGIAIEAHFDIAYNTLTTSGGNLYVELPYKVRKASGKPFVGVAQVSGITYTGDYVIWNAIPDTYRLELWAVTSAGATANVTDASNGSGTFIGTINYIGQEDEGD